jgi:DNA repair exonuclease SbcCD ATPase subunit
MGIIDKLFGLKTSKQYADVISALEVEIRAVQDELEDRRARLRRAPFEPAEIDMDELRRQVRDAEARVTELKGFVTEAQDRQQQASAKELSAQVERRMSEARKDWKRLRQVYIAIDAAAWQLRERLIERADLENRLKEANDFAADNERGDLLFTPPLQMLVNHCKVNESMTGIPFPVQLPGYFPIADLRGRLLQRMKEIVEPNGDIARL